MTQQRATAAASSAGSANWPLFYRDPVLLRFEEHRGKGLKPVSGFAFSTAATAVPLLLGEFAQAARHFPIVFTVGDNPVPLAVLGLREGQNLFVAADGRWRDGVYIPAYLRRYPFIVLETPNGGEPLLAVDAASDRFVDLAQGEGAMPLFEATGAPSAAASEVIGFCHAFHQDHLRGAGFGRALAQRGLLAQRHATIRFPDESRAMLNGFSLVDEAAFRALKDPEILVDWHARGWLDAISLHLASAGNWDSLMRLNAEQAARA